MKTENETENDMRNHLEHVFKLVSKSTTKKGINVMAKEISKIDSDKSQLIIQIGTYNHCICNRIMLFILFAF